MANVRYGKEKCPFLNLSKEEEKKSFNKLYKLKDTNPTEYKKERDKIILGNLGLAYKIAYQFSATKLPIDDLIQQGVVGLITAVDYFDISKDTKFSTYAYYWIWEHINRFRRKNKHIMHLGVTAHTIIFHYSQARTILSAKLDRQPTNKEVADEIHIPLKKLEEYLTQFRPAMNLDEKLPNRTQATYYHDIIPDRNSTPIKEDITILTNTQMKYLERKMKRLTDKEKLVVGYLFGIIDGRAYLATEIGQMMNLTRERIRQIKNKAFQKLNITTEEYINKWSKLKRK